VGSEFLIDGAPLSNKTYTEIFYEVFPFYLTAGMTYDQFWNGGASLPKYYRDAYKMKQEHENYFAWLQGAYFYDALCAVSPVLNAFAKEGTRPVPYHEQPYKMKSEQEDTDAEQQNPQGDIEQAKFEAFASRFNQQFEQKGGEIDAGND